MASQERAEELVDVKSIEGDGGRIDEKRGMSVGFEAQEPQPNSPASH